MKLSFDGSTLRLWQIRPVRVSIDGPCCNAATNKTKKIPAIRTTPIAKYATIFFITYPPSYTRQILPMSIAPSSLGAISQPNQRTFQATLHHLATLKHRKHTLL